MRILFSISICILSIACKANELDSLWNVYNSSTSDTVRVKTIFELSYQYFISDPDTTIYLCKEAESISTEIDYQFGLSESYGWLGYMYQKRGITSLALEYFIKSWKIREKMGDLDGVGNALNNIGYIYDNQKDYEQALTHYQKALEIREKTGNKEGMANVINNIAYTYDMKGDLDKGIEFYSKALNIRRELNDERGMAESYHNLGACFRIKNEFDLALKYYQKSLALQQKLNDKNGTANSMNGIAQVYKQTNKLDSAEFFALRSYELGKQLDYPNTINSASSVLRNLYKQQGNFEKALAYFEIYIATRDSINNANNQKEVIRQQTQYEFEKRTLVEAQERKEQERRENEQVNRRNNLQYSGIFVFVLLMFAIIFMSVKFSLSERMAEGLIFFTFLLFFEFCLVLLDPFIENLSGGEPLYKLLFNAILAAGVFPLHAFFENTIKRRILK